MLSVASKFTPRVFGPQTLYRWLHISPRVLRPSPQLTHIDNTNGRLNMVNVVSKPDTVREATARGQVLLQSTEAFQLVESNSLAKGDVLTIAQIAGIQGAKQTPTLVPLCHPIGLADVKVKLWLDRELEAVEIEACTVCRGPTGVEMEALTAVTVAGLTVIDMCKSVARGATLSNIRVVYKAGGKSGVYRAD
ncbi:hypothetical protein IWQ62_000252 [Dispira parvispora]|uniref:cyclic pyranopterin monophosphate synthase n=1 Tax=Dispira parvispora TaxID=1520584 RepID=A0A9W8AV63_9FUNG|nr:hypothetical protein IWQ62_000252 [Dispira parvispora]